MDILNMAVMPNNAALYGGITSTIVVMTKESLMGNKQYLTNTASQRQRILEHLRHAPLTTLQAREYLDIMHPSQRVKELKERGHNILTNLITDDSGKAKHNRVAQLLSKGQ